MVKLVSAKGIKGEDASPVMLYFDTVDATCAKGVDMLEELGLHGWRDIKSTTGVKVTIKLLQQVLAKLNKCITEDDDYTGLAKGFLEDAIDWGKKNKSQVRIEIEINDRQFR
jgi:hypothetical protein